MTQSPAAAIADIMLASTSLPLPDLLTELERRGVGLSPAEFEAAWLGEELRLLARIELTEPPVVINLARALEGHVFTHRLVAEEVERDLLFTLPDFAGIWPIIDTGPFDELDGRQIVDDFDQEALQAVIRLRPGTLGGYGAGTLVAITVHSDGLTLSTAAEPEPEPAALALLTSAVGADRQEVFDASGATQDDGDLTAPVALEEFLALVLVRHPDLFIAAGWPVADLLAQLDLDHDNGSVAVAGFDFAGYDQAQPGEMMTEAERIEMLVSTYDLGPDEAAAVVTFSDLIDDLHDEYHDLLDDGGTEGEVPPAPIAQLVPMLPALADPMVAVAIAEENLTGDPHVLDVVLAMLEALEPEVPRRAQAGTAWLLGRCLDLIGDVDDAEAAYQKALGLDDDFFPAMRELASFASLRGDAVKAISLLQRAGVSADDPELVAVSKFSGEQRAEIGRNDLCWCGSGRKYKKCHLGRSDHDLEARRDWLYEKASQWVRNSSGRDLLVDLATIRARQDPSPAALVAALNDPLVMDAALFEGELLAEFLASRGSALPADELELATRWLDTSRLLYTVRRSGPGSPLVLAEDGSDELIEVESVVGAGAPGTAARAGELLCLRLLPAGHSLAVSGGIQVVPASARDLIVAGLALDATDELNAESIVSMLGAAQGPGPGPGPR